MPFRKVKVGSAKISSPINWWHGVWFEEAQTVVVNPLSLMAPNDHPDGNRTEYLGHSVEKQVLYVVTVEQSDDEIRIISARKATAHERKGYEERV